MRIALYILVLANLALFAGSRWLAPQQPGAGAAAGVTTAGAAAPARILLASERPPPAAAADPAPVDGASSPASALLPEGAVVTEAAFAVAGSAAEPPAVAEADARRCVSMGPFTGLDAAAEATALLKQDGYEPRQRPANGPVPDGYMVVIGQLKAQADQGRVIRRLNSGGLDDAFALPRLDDGYAVSVGLFSQAPRAERRALAVGRMGLKADVVGRTRPGTVYWLDFDLKTPGGEPPGTPGSAPASADPSQALQVVSCPEPRPVG